MVLDRGMNVGHVERHRQPPREGVEVAQVDFALARGLQLPFEPGRELAHHHRDEDEQNQVEDLVRVRDAEGCRAAERRRRRKRARRRPRQRSPRRCPSAWPRSPPGSDRPPSRGRGRSRRPVRIDEHGHHRDHAQGRQNAAQFLADAVEIQRCRRILLPAGGRLPFGRRTIYAGQALSVSCLSWPAWLDSSRPNRLFQALFGLRRGGRAVECTALEMRHTGKGIGGSNPSLSASASKRPVRSATC